jgi:ABC-type branched-subunit amino acid transport system ATPase component/predicted MFS family arabinose efflux permease
MSGVWARWKARTTGGAPFFPLGVLFGLNMVDELDRTAFGVLLPEIRDAFGLDMAGVLAVVALASVGALVLSLPLGFVADRVRRTRLAAGGAATWAGFSALTAVATNVWMLGTVRAGSGLGQAVNVPTHSSLLADYYDAPVRPRVYAVHRYANAMGMVVGPISAGLLAYWWGWRAPFVVFAVVTAVFVVVALRLREPVRGRLERQAAGVSDEVADTEEESPSWAESWRIVWQLPTMRRVYMALPFLALSFTGFATLGGLYYDEVFGLDERARGFLSGGVEGVASLVGLLVGIPVASRLTARDPALVVRFYALVAAVITVGWVVFALAPTVAVSVGAHLVMSACGFVLAPGMYSVISQAVPPKVRGFGFALGQCCLVPGLLLLPVVGAIADTHGIRVGMLVTAPVFLVFGLILSSAGSFVGRDIRQVQQTAAARSEVAHLRRHGQAKLLLARGIEVHYDGVQVLFGVDLEVDEGEIVALLGTNGAGKSTVLRALSGLVQPSAGAVIFDGRDLTHAPPDEVAARGIAQVPGGQGVFGQLSVADNLRLAAWLQRRRPAEARQATERVLETFPILRDRLDESAGNLSGGQQQMLTLGMAFIGRPRLLMIDELSLGLAPAVVAQLLEMVRLLKDQGRTIILVEQSVNIALTVAERAYFLEKGEVRFQGPTAELLDRPDLLRSVFLSDGAAGAPQVSATPGGNGDAPQPASVRAGSGDVRTPEQGADGMSAADRPVVLEVRDVTRSFGGVRALDGVSFDVVAHEILGFIGPNGAGKTTLFDVISGFIPADRGSIRLHTEAGWRDLDRLRSDLRAWEGLGRSFQDGRLFAGLTVAETIAVACEQRIEVRDPVASCLRLPWVRASERHLAADVGQLVELLGLGAYRDKFVRELSTGTRRIVDLACVLAHGPSVVLLDEPSSGIAQREAEALAPVLRQVRRELGASLLVIEHDLPLLSSIADRMIALDLGRVVTHGRPDDVLHHPDVVASYLGTDEAAIARSTIA